MEIDNTTEPVVTIALLVSPPQHPALLEYDLEVAPMPGVGQFEPHERRLLRVLDRAEQDEQQRNDDNEAERQQQDQPERRERAAHPHS
ncbi:hypothetical protein OMP38_19895 [Cohnella ginsengisoli]|uniref:Uncharacterized protein n=1 Tax=Cohnella ginsengisoli TaxID=425004 RepID=A0A9X4KJ27_9BACL|nr:hypothetical protein [Cohnella ginsengisoli]MDG0792883.1 hypothetical protein [Cohnella ginsengisoli]